MKHTEKNIFKVKWAVSNETAHLFHMYGYLSESMIFFGSSGIVVGRDNIQRNDRLSIWQSDG